MTKKFNLRYIFLCILWLSRHTKSPDSMSKMRCMDHEVQAQLRLQERFKAIRKKNSGIGGTEA